MESWKIDKFCETATLEQLRRTRLELEGGIAQGRLTGIAAHAALRRVEEAITLRMLFGEG